MRFLAIFCLFISILSCSDDTVTLVKQPGEISGKVLPTGIFAKVSLQQGDYIKSVEVDNFGQFIIKDVAPGIYTFMAKASGYGRYERENIKIEDDEGYEIGVIELDTIPFPLIEISETIFTTRRSRENQVESYVTIRFEKLMDLNSLKNAISFAPHLNNMQISTTSNLADNNSFYYVYGDFITGTDYQIKLDTSIQTFWGEKLEFPYSLNLKNELLTEELYITDIQTDMLTNGISYLPISFNYSLKEDQANFVSISPYLPLKVESSGSRLYLYPINSWIPDQEYSVTIFKDLSDIIGNTLGKDSTFTFLAPSLTIVNTSPNNEQILLQDVQSITINFNYMIDIASLSENSIIIEPEADYTISMALSFSKPTLYLTPTQLMENTEYKITINSNLKDYWGNNLKEPYSFSFWTKK